DNTSRNINNFKLLQVCVYVYNWLKLPFSEVFPAVPSRLVHGLDHLFDCDPVIDLSFMAHLSISGNPNPDPAHPDYVPTIFKKILTPRTVLQGNKKLERFKSAKRRKLFQSPTNQSDEENEENSNEGQSETHADNDEGPEFTAVRLQEHESWQEAGFRRCVEQTEREQFQIEMNNLRSERNALAGQLKDLKTTKFGAHIVEDNDEKCKFYTGLSWIVFLKTYMFLQQFLPPAKPGTLTLRDQFFITLVKLRQNPNFD
ncbi:MAG: hypothetical protein AB2708_16325, partial [Candidatus Thiodiazotropha taylori]